MVYEFLRTFFEILLRFWVIEVFAIIMREMSIKTGGRMLKDVLWRMIFPPDK